MKIGNFKIKKSTATIICLIILSLLMIKGYSFINSDINMTSTVKIKKYERALYDIIKNKAIEDNVKSTYVESPTGIDFSTGYSNTNGQGVYLRHGTETNDFPIYYYRGNIIDNNVLFANYCWKMVRTTDTGGIKMIFNGEPVEGKCNNTGDATILKSIRYNSKQDSLAYVGYMYGTTYNQESQTGPTGVFGSSVTYSKGNYTLNTTSTSLDNNHHYSCGDESTSCTSVRFYYYLVEDAAYYITLSGGKVVDDNFFNEMFSNDVIDTGGIKNYIENDWYENHMTSYTSKIEDTVYCADRTIYDKGGWDPNGGDLQSPLYFGPYGRMGTEPSLECVRDDDKFTTDKSNGNGKLKYPVGLLTSDEAILAGTEYGIRNDSYLNNDTSYWLISPHSFESLGADGIAGALNFHITNGGPHYHFLNATAGIRPVISLKNSSIITSGNGTVDSPYVVKEN